LYDKTNEKSSIGKTIHILNKIIAERVVEDKKHVARNKKTRKLSS